MANLTITNLTSDPVYVGDLYTTIAASSAITVTRPASALAGMAALQKLIAAGTVALGVVYEAYETASGLLAAPAATEAVDMAAVAATDAAAGAQTIRKLFTAGVGGAPDDITIYAVNTLPYKMRIMDAVLNVSTNVALSTCDVRSAAAGGGTLVCSLDSATVGRAEMTSPSVVLTPGAVVGLFIRRSDSGVAGELVLNVRREA